MPHRRWRAAPADLVGVAVVSALHVDADHFRARLLQDALTEATAQYWLRRADQLAAGAPRPDDFHGQATPEELADRAQRAKAAAEACRRHARLLRMEPEPINQDMLDVLQEVA